MIKDSSFKDMVRFKKYKDVYNFNSIEGIVALISSIIITIVITIIISQTSIDNVNTIIRSLTKDIGIAMIGLLGFVVTGLAILTSSISNKIMNIVMKRNKLEIIERILLSFYLLSFIIASVVTLSLFSYMITFLNISINFIFVAFLTFILSYLIIFSFFYSVALVGNCIQIFKIINLIDESYDNNLSPEEKNLYNSFRITALEQSFFSNNKLSQVQKIHEYKKVICVLIDEECKDELQKQRMKGYVNMCFGDN
ncbi:hypothetical protein LL033_08255 [Clostridium estertheticum]|uniref:hypothetical protein n=1 Tax=Clostridium estertheticum TaxID=238834 RepID=UPI001C0DF3B0|nr:hypothetical protein [Clostridium estertheticum]MBU3214801.1 hypothetical protein [Clostridium estertheticum]WAG57211.1 hypothetical protein LL033_08255 [Clostridium estertheticum]